MEPAFGAITWFSLLFSLALFCTYPRHLSAQTYRPTDLHLPTYPILPIRKWSEGSSGGSGCLLLSSIALFPLCTHFIFFSFLLVARQDTPNTRHPELLNIRSESSFAECVFPRPECVLRLLSCESRQVNRVSSCNSRSQPFGCRLSNILRLRPSATVYASRASACPIFRLGTIYQTRCLATQILAAPSTRISWTTEIDNTCDLVLAQEH